jgi:hypothetical protein
VTREIEGRPARGDGFRLVCCVPVLVKTRVSIPGLNPLASSDLQIPAAAAATVQRHKACERPIGNSSDDMSLGNGWGGGPVCIGSTSVGSLGCFQSVLSDKKQVMWVF